MDDHLHSLFSWVTIANIEMHSLFMSWKLTQFTYELNHESSYEFPCSC